MSLGELADKIQRVEVHCGESSFTVGHLSADDLAELRTHHVVRLLEMVAAYAPLLLDPAPIKKGYGALSVILEMSDAIGHVIALAAREPNLRQVAANLPAGVQFRALIEILKLSAAGELKFDLDPALSELLASVASLSPEEIN